MSDRFERASRDNVLRCHNPVSGPYTRRGFDGQDRIVMLACVIGAVTLVAFAVVGWL
jgi:hypothetical protein